MRNNLRPWQSGQSGNPAGRPQGSLNVKSRIAAMLDDPSVCKKLPNGLRDGRTPLEVITDVLIEKAQAGDIKAADTLLKYAVDRSMSVEITPGLFTDTKLEVTVVNKTSENDG